MITLRVDTEPLSRVQSAALAKRPTTPKSPTPPVGQPVVVVSAGVSAAVTVSDSAAVSSDHSAGSDGGLRESSRGSQQTASQTAGSTEPWTSSSHPWSLTPFQLAMGLGVSSAVAAMLVRSLTLSRVCVLNECCWCVHSRCHVFVCWCACVCVRVCVCVCVCVCVRARSFTLSRVCVLDECHANMAPSRAPRFYFLRSH
jgi:hypothetical protein